MKVFKLDASIVCFGLVMIAAIPVAALRAKTYAIGYELGKLKEQERVLRQKNVELQFEQAGIQRSVREKLVSKSGSDSNAVLRLPETGSVIHHKGPAVERSRADME